MHFYESVLIDTIDGIQCKVYANSHPEGFVIVKPKYIPESVLDFTGLKKRFLFGKCMTRFNLFNKKEIVEENLARLKSTFAYYFYECPLHKNWFLVVPKDKIKKTYDTREGVKELMKVPVDNVDPYLKATQGFIELMLKSGIRIDDIGITHSTLLGNYTYGKSDIDILVFGKDNGWKVLNFLETAEHPLLKWKSEEDWAKYYRDRVISTQYSEKEYVYNMVKKKDDGLFDGNVFSIFCVEEPDELWYNWNDNHEPLGTVKLRGTVGNVYNSIVRPGYYDLQKSEVIEGHENIPVKRIVTWSRPFVLQAREGEQVEACGLLEKVTPQEGEPYYQIVIGYFDTYTTDRGKEEYLKVLVD
ncbi:hypothetical protein HOL21_03360 [Candidatus Woesearchaeota archaeon]|jgi:uncharacterized protein|nr:hypothetical protein [Candidatus Woesearchaeota archaeon]MBT5397224.1 hypothetical protein [Candidatus Woesearchaeota archaeon]MBT5924419.1 hypothetical protein [Candidatus Woesearchaeota archaeon]MBT6367230.1 hypothetical protein [Candidatus Woesearchaeota archaeon]MBT7762624.1 hypothetical protein [Candidatus Woesearchaeota archaeon]